MKKRFLAKTYLLLGLTFLLGGIHLILINSTLNISNLQILEILSGLFAFFAFISPIHPDNIKKNES